MPSTYLTAGQSAPSANTDTTLYTVPASKSFVGSSIVICNRNTSSHAKFRVAVVPSGETLGNEHYLFYDMFVEARDSIIKLLGLSLATGDRVVVRADSADLSFSLFGSELS